MAVTPSLPPAGAHRRIPLHKSHRLRPHHVSANNRESICCTTSTVDRATKRSRRREAMQTSCSPATRSHVDVRPTPRTCCCSTGGMVSVRRTELFPEIQKEYRQEGVEDLPADPDAAAAPHWKGSAEGHSHLCSGAWLPSCRGSTGCETAQALHAGDCAENIRYRVASGVGVRRRTRRRTTSASRIT